MMITSGLLGIHITTTKALRAVMMLAVALGAGTVFGQGHTLWQDGGVQLCGARADRLIAATSDSAGGAIVVWEDARSSPEGIYAQRVSASGVPLWTENGVLVCDSTGPTVSYVAVDDGKHGVIATWAPYRLAFAVQRVSAVGVPLWGADGLTLRPYVDSLQEVPALVNDGHGGAIVVWSALNVHLDTLIACRVDSGGSKRWETAVHMDTLGAVRPGLCPDGEGGVIAAWPEYEDGVRRVKVQRIDSAGVIRWGAAGVLACTLSTAQEPPVVVPVSESCFVVSFYVGSGSTWRIRAQMLDLAGNRRWGLAGVPVSGTSGSCWGEAGVAGGGYRQSFWLWSENRGGVDCFFAQKLDSAGTRCWDSTGVWLGTADASNYSLFSATTDGRGGAIAAWSLYRGPLDWDVYAQHADSTGHLAWSDTGLAICPGDNNVRSPVCASDGDGGAIVVWDDDRGLYAQRVADGAGVMETPNAEVRTANASPTVVRGVLFLPTASRRKPQATSLLDACGRRVLEVHEGANDISRVAPGVYFVRGAQAQAEAQVVHKVIIAR
jgi:hypothetical protein